MVQEEESVPWPRVLRGISAKDAVSLSGRAFVVVGAICHEGVQCEAVRGRAAGRHSERL